MMEVSLALQPGDSLAALTIGAPGTEMAVRLGRLGGAATFTVIGSPIELRRLGSALLEAAAAGEE